MWSAALSSIHSTILVAIGRHPSVRSTEATSLHMGLGAHVLMLCLAGHILVIGRVSCIGQANRLTCVGMLDHVSRLGHAVRLCMHQLFHTSHVAGGPPEAAAIREDHFRKISLERPSDGPIMSSSSLKHVQHNFGGHWPTSVREVHWGHASWATPVGLAVCVCTWWSCWPHLTRSPLRSSLHAHVAGGPFGPVGGPRGPFLKSSGGAAI